MAKKPQKLRKKLKLGFNFGPPYIFWSNYNMAHLFIRDLSLRYKQSTMCWVTSKTKQHGRKIKKYEKISVSFKPFLLHFWTLNGYNFHYKQLLVKIKKLTRVFWIIDLSVLIDSCKCVDKRSNWQLNSGIKSFKFKRDLPIYFTFK